MADLDEYKHHLSTDFFNILNIILMISKYLIAQLQIIYAFIDNSLIKN